MSSQWLIPLDDGCFLLKGHSKSQLSTWKTSKKCDRRKNPEPIFLNLSKTPNSTIGRIVTFYNRQYKLPKQQEEKILYEDQNSTEDKTKILAGKLATGDSNVWFLKGRFEQEKLQETDRKIQSGAVPKTKYWLAAGNRSRNFPRWCNKYPKKKMWETTQKIK